MNRGTRLRWATIRAGLLAVVLLAGVLAQLAPAVVTAPVVHANPLAADGSSLATGTSVGTPAPTPAPVPTPTSGDPAVPLPLPGPVTSPAPATPIVDPTTAIGRPHPVAMPQGAVALIPGQAAHFSGSDGAFAVDVPADAVTAADVAAGGGALSLLITQLVGPSGSIAGGSGQVTYGTYVAQVVDATGAVAATGLRDAPTFTLHLAGKFGPLDLSQVTVVFNGPLPVWAADALAPVAVAPTASVPAGVIRAGTSSGTITGASRGGSSLGTFGQPASRRAIYDPQRRALVVTAPKANAPAFFPRRGEAARNALQPQAAGAAGGGAPSTALTWNTQAALATFGSPDPFNVDLSGGGLTTAIPISVPAGPGGLTPPVQLTYSSASVSEQHNVQAPAGWVGSGWNLSLGSISWSERFNIDSCTTASCANGGNNWESVWQISDPFGTSAQLIPPDINYSTYWDDSPWFPCDIGTTTQTPTHACPVIWHTAPETHAKVVMYKSGITPPEAGSALAPCWRVYLPSGIMEEFGCTSDSLAYFFGQNGADEVYAWNLDLITDLNGNQIHVGYRQDTATKTVGGVGHSYIRDTVLDHIEWDSPTCLNPQTACPTSGTAPNLWAPHARVTFQSSPRPARGGYGPAAACNTDANLRCDDPISLQNSGGLGIPDVYSTSVLNDIDVQVSATGTASPATWASAPVLRDYRLSYWEWGPGTITDPVSGQSESIAGANLLTQVQQFDGQTSGALSLSARTFSYGNAQTQYYEDDLHAPASAAGCGPSWNAIANGGHCYLWSQSWWTNSYYLASANNGMGLYQVFTWNLARNDTHGLPAGASAGDPFYCNSHPTGDPCDEADDQNWSRTTLTVVDAEVDQIAQAGSGAQPVTTTMDSHTTYAYTLTTSLPAPECANCTMGMYWGNINDSDYLDYYNVTFMGFKTATVTHPDSSAEVHTYLTTEGYGLYDAITGTSGQVRCVAGTTNSCQSAPWWDLANVGHGRETLADSYDTGYTPGGTTRLLHETATAYQVVCATGSGGTPTWSGWGNWVGNHLVAGADLNDPVTVCEVQPTSTITHFYEGQSAILPYRETLFQTYDSFGRLTQSLEQASGGSPWQIVHKTWYVWDDAVSASVSGATGEYVITRPAFTDIETVGGVRTSCASTAYAGVPLSFGNVNIGRALPTTETTYASGCGAGTTSNPIATTAPTGPISVSLTYDAYGHRTDTKDAEGTAGNVAHTGCGGGWSACTSYDTTYQTLPLSASNALNQTASTGYGAATDAHAGFGWWPTSATDANGQVSSVTYDTLGRVLTERAPGETAAYTTQWAYNTSACPPTGLVASPCVEVDQTQRLSATATLTTRQFYDGLGRLIETRTPAPTTGQDLVAFAQYDTSGRVTWQSAPYSVPAYTGTGSPFAIPDTTQPHSTFTYDGLGRVLHATDPLGHVTAHSYSVGSAVFGVHGGNGDLVTTTIDANGHKTDVWTDPFGRTNIVRRFTGNTLATYTLYAQTQAWYSYQGPVGSLIHADGTTQTSFSYDLAGRLTSASDPDSGSWHYTYDLDGNVTQQTDARGTSVYAAYDGLDRPLWQSANADGTSPLATDAYDDTTAGNMGIGRLTTEGYASGPNQAVTGTYAYVYDGRGRPTSTSLTIQGPGAPQATYTVGTSYDDADRLATMSLPATGDLPAETLTSAYNDGTDGALASLSSSLTSPTSTLFQLPTYTGQGLLNGWKSGIASGNPAWQASVSLGYDGDLRVTDSKLTRTDTISGLSLPISEVQPSYDAAGNVSSVTTTLAAVGSTPGGSETQAFCYDDLDRLTWAGTQGTGPCGRAGSEGITGAGYTASYAYDTFDRLTSASVLNSAGVALPNAAQGTYTYGASGHLHAVSTVGSGATGYSAAYDAAGEMTCRAVGASTCTNATPTGQTLGYDALRRLISWQNATTSPTATGAYAYDGSGSRVWQQDAATNGGVTTTTTTTYILGFAEITSTQIGQAASTTTATRFYSLPGGVSALRDVAGLSYVASDQLGTPIATLNLDTGAVLGEQLRAPYGQARYAASAQTNGGMRTTVGFTGQREDASAAGSSGLDYFNARYYDPVVGRFTSADSAVGSDALLDGYAYVGGQVEGATDPSGHYSINNETAPVGGPGGAGEPDLGEWFKGAAPAIGRAIEIAGWALTGGILASGDASSNQQPIQARGAIVHMPVLPGLSSLPSIRESDVLSHRPPVPDPTPTPTPGPPPVPSSGPTGTPVTDTFGSGTRPPGGPPVATGTPPPDDDNCGCKDISAGPDQRVYLHRTRGNADLGMSVEDVMQDILSHGRLRGSEARLGTGVYAWEMGPGGPPEGARLGSGGWPSNPLAANEVVFTTDLIGDAGGRPFGEVGTRIVTFRIPEGEYMSIKVLAGPGDCWHT